MALSSDETIKREIIDHVGVATFGYEAGYSLRDLMTIKNYLKMEGLPLVIMVSLMDLMIVYM